MQLGATMNRLQPVSTIRFAKIDGLIVILDLQSENYFILNATATHIWNLLLDEAGDVDAVLLGVSAAYPEADRSEVLADIEAVIEEWKNKGFLDHWPKVATHAPETKPYHFRHAPSLALSAWWSLARTAFTLWQKGFAWTYLECANLPSSSARGNSRELLRAANAAFVQAENLFHFASAPHDCLPRSLALFRFCRGIGLPVGHRIGGRRFPQFAMHAWVECANEVVLDDPDCRCDFTVLASIPP